MSEPTEGSSQQPDPDPKKDTGDPFDADNTGRVQDQSSESIFNDPTAPVWVDPTTSIPTPPPPPGYAQPQDQGDQSAANPLASPPADPTTSNPYAQQPPAPQYAQQPPPPQYAQQPPPPQYAQQPPPQYAQQPPPYGQAQQGQQYPTYGQQYGVYGQQSYASGPPTETNTSAIVLTILSGGSLLFCNLFAIASLVLGIIALTRNTTDRGGSRRLTKIGWIVFAASWAVLVLVVIGILVVAGNDSSISDSNFGI